MLTAHLLPGLLTGFGLIVAIGAQNAWVLRQGLARDHVAVIVTICALPTCSSSSSAPQASVL